MKAERKRNPQKSSKGYEAIQHAPDTHQEGKTSDDDREVDGQQENPRAEAKNCGNAGSKMRMEAENKLLVPAIDRKIARETLAKVSLALYGGMYVAVKEFENDSRPAKWEARTLSKLRHSNIVMFSGCEFERAPFLLTPRYIGHPREPPLTIHSALAQETFTQLVTLWVRVLT